MTKFHQVLLLVPGFHCNVPISLAVHLKLVGGHAGHAKPIRFLGKLIGGHAMVGMPKSGSVRFSKYFGERQTGLMFGPEVLLNFEPDHRFR